LFKLPGPIPLDAQLCFAIYSTTIALGRLYKPMLDGFGITYPQYLVLSVLWEKDGQAIGAIAERLALESSTITPLVKRLETAGFVRRDRNPEDERQVVVTLTSKGRALHHDTKCLSETLLESSGFTPQALVRLHGDISALRDALVRNLPTASGRTDADAGLA
jgi:MarR family transcriptional regulator, organic hydroperoxide resistance regulator